jgi:transposase
MHILEKQLSSEELLAYVQPVLKGDEPLTSVYRNQQGGEPKLIAEVYKSNKTLSAEVNGESVTWQERRLVVRSMQQAKASGARLRARVAKAKTEVGALNSQGQGKRRFDGIQSLKEAAEAIMKHYDVQGCLQLSFEEIVINRRKVGRYKDRPERICEKRKFIVNPAIDDVALGLAIEKLGWRVYGANQPSEQLSLEQAVLAYRDEYIIERGFGRFKGRPLSLSPLYLQRDDHVTGLIRLLSIGLRVLTLIEFVVRRHLNEQQTTLQGLYAGNPKRATARPTSELLLESFEDITLTFIHTLNQTQGHLTPLLEVQKRILYLLDFSVSIYTRLCTNFEKPP